jgi:uroporphyrinogen-III synthase
MATAVRKNVGQGETPKAAKPAASPKVKKEVAAAAGPSGEDGPAPAKAAKKSAVAKPAPRNVSKILITQPKPDTDKSPYFELARKHSLELEFHPFIRVEGVSGRDFRRQRVDIAEYTAIIFTSRSAVDHFFRILEEMKVKVSQEMKYCCITEAVALYLQKFILYRKRKVFFSADGSVQGLLDVIGKHKAEKYVLPTSDSGKNEIHQYLTKLNIPFAEVTLYHTVSNDIDEVMKKHEYDMIVFFSPFSVQALLSHDPAYKQNGTLIGAFGPTTAKAVEDSGLQLDVKAPAPNAPSMVSALERYLDENKK